MTLNAAQQAVVDSKAALRVVIAGPGSGKTRTLVEAVAVARGKVAVMTFTNAGAAEFRERIDKTVITDGEYPFKLVYCGTLHGYCFKLIQRFGSFLGYIPGKVAILPDKERIPRLLACRDKLGYGKRISERELMSGGLRNPLLLDSVALVWREYEFLLKRNNLVDFDLILRDGLALLQMTPVRHQVQLEYLFVDEYQDSALIDQKIYEAIPALNQMYAGDSDQSIFAFRGANSMGFVHLAKSVFDNSITDAEGFKLEVNYRSDTKICAVANLLIRHNKERIDKDCVPATTEMGGVSVFDFDSAGEELSWLHTAIVFNTHSQVSIAVLYRMNHDVKVCRDYLRSMGIPVHDPRNYAGHPTDWERALLLLGLVHSPTNEILAERYLKLDHAPSDVDRWILEARTTGDALIRGHIHIAVDPGEGGFKREALLFAQNGVSESTVNAIAARANMLGPDADLSDLLHDLHSPDLKNEEVASNDAGVYVGTMHSAKGREWDVVFLPAFEQGIIPSAKSLELLPLGTRRERSEEPLIAYDRALVEEERRLAFVAVTRARHELYISHCAHRRGPWGPVGLGQPSQFIREMGLPAHD